tara:strand:+ start:335 stop:1399 length:1065 start_codon:yes stop_codon:yes gene_type:complete
MAYFLGRDVAIGLTTEQPHYALELDSGDLKVSGTAANPLESSKVFVPRRQDVGTTAESTKVTLESNAKADYASTASNNKYVLLYDSQGQKFLITFDTGSSTAPTTLDEDFAVHVNISGSGEDSGNFAQLLKAAVDAQAGFAAAFTISRDDKHITFLDKITGSAVDAERGTGFTNSILLITQVADGANAALADLPTVKLTDVTGVDFTFGSTDEDIAYFGQRTALKAEIKNEITLSITRKKSNAGFSQLFNEARCGIRGTATAVTEVAAGLNTVEMNNNLNQPLADIKGSGYGYRLYLQLKAGTEVMSLPNMCISEYSISLNADAVQEETIVFYGNVKPIIGTLPDDTETTETDF